MADHIRRKQQTSMPIDNRRNSKKITPRYHAEQQTKKTGIKCRAN